MENRTQACFGVDFADFFWVSWSASTKTRGQQIHSKFTNSRLSPRQSCFEASGPTKSANWKRFARSFQHIMGDWRSWCVAPETEETYQKLVNWLDTEIPAMKTKFPFLELLCCADFKAMYYLRPSKDSQEMKWLKRSEREAAIAAKQSVDSTVKNYPFCPFCDAGNLDGHNLNLWAQVDIADRTLGQQLMKFIYCCLHARLRISEKFIKRLLLECIRLGNLKEAVALILEKHPEFSYSYNESRGKITLTGLSTIPKMNKLLHSPAGMKLSPNLLFQTNNARKSRSKFLLQRE